MVHGPDHARRIALLGKRVRVTLHREPDQTTVVAVGLLLGFGDEGTVEIEQDDGFVHYCWPMLDVTEHP